MARFKDLPDVFAMSSGIEQAEAEQALTIRPSASESNSSLQTAACRVFGRKSIPVMVDLDTRSVYPIRS